MKIRKTLVRKHKSPGIRVKEIKKAGIHEAFATETGEAVVDGILRNYRIIIIFEKLDAEV